jgi:phospholipase C
MIEAEVVNGQVTTQYQRLSYINLGQLDDDYYFNDLNSNSINVSLSPSDTEPILLKINFECDGPTEVPTTNHILPDLDMLEFYVTLKLSFDRVQRPDGTGKLDFLSWIDKIKNLKDDDFDEALKKYVVAHITSPHSYDIGGTFQGKMRDKIYGKLTEGATRDSLNNTISRWILGGDGNYNVTSLVNDGQNLTINYLVPKNKLDPFPDSMFRPAGWPYAGNPNPTIKFPLLKKLKDIEHIVVLTMENRSFDQMLGYLSLPVSAGGMGRKDVDGLDKAKPNFFEGASYPVVAFGAGDTAFATDPSHSYQPVFRQINADINTPGSGKMDGFVKSFTIDALAGNPGRIMGYHTAVNVPVYDALVRDFGISHRWFASHPGPTFCNRFYELTGRLNLASGLNKDLPENWWEFSNSSPLTPVFNKTIFDHLTEYSNSIDSTVTWKYYEHGYCFLRFFSKYTFNNTNVVSIDDPLNGFFTDAKNGTLPSVSFIDPHFIELPPNANCDGPVADIKAGQDLVRRVVEAVVTGPKFSNTLLIITYDEHGGFYDHVPPPPATSFSDESPIKTYGVRVPAFFISPRIEAGSVFGHDQNGSGTTLYFDHTSILKTIARRFMSKNPPYMGPRYAAANDLTAVLASSPRKWQFLPFVKYNITYNASEMRINVEGGNPTPGPLTGRFNLTETDEQRFSFEQIGTHVYIRTHCGSLYVTADISAGNVGNAQAGVFGIKHDVKYDDGLALVDPKKFNAKYQRWKFTPLGTSDADKNLYIITSDYYPNKILQPLDIRQNATPLVLAPKPKSLSAANAWVVSGPLLSS